MPSIYNHENACWGVKKSFSNVLHCDFNDNLQTRKVVINALPNSSNSVKYSVSSNVYYGYQPHNGVQNPLQSCDNNAMDIDVGLSNIPASQFLQNTEDSKPFVYSSTPHFQFISRKRQISGEFLENSKRKRQQDTAQIAIETSTCNSHKGDGVGSRVNRLRSQLSEGSENEATAELLRLTHGCEVYLYERSCDY